MDAETKPSAPQSNTLRAWSLIALLFIVIVLLEGLTGDRSELRFQGGKPSFPLILSATGAPLEIHFKSGPREELVIAEGIGTTRLQRDPSRAKDAGYEVRSLDDGTVRTRLSFRRSPTQKTVSLRPPSGIEAMRLDSFDLRVVKSTRATIGGYEALGWLVVVCFACIPVVCLLGRSPVFSQWVFAASTLTWMLFFQPAFALALLAFLVFVHRLGLECARNHITGKGASAWNLLRLGGGMALAFLLVGKYGADAVAELFANPGGLALAMPLGISYFVIRVLDTQLRWYRGDLVDVSLREFLAYVLFPATVAAGPIATLPGFRKGWLGPVSLSEIGPPIRRILQGIAKKIVLVQIFLGGMLFGIGPVAFDPGLMIQVLWDPMGVTSGRILMLPFLMLLYSYLDFSAYSDIAIGFSRLLGVRMVENFNWPILASDLQEYWRRWHMSLSGWCQRNIFMPATLATRNQFVPAYLTMLAVGLWHAFALPWFLWALHHATGLIVLSKWRHRRGRKRELSRGRICAGVGLTLTFAAAGYSFAFIGDTATALAIYGRFWITLVTLGQI